MSKIDESTLQTKQQYEACFLSEVCDYLDRNKYVYRVMYREWVDTPDVPIMYENGHYQTRCDLAIFLLIEQQPVRLLITFKVNQYAYKLEYRSQSLLRDTKNGVRKRDADFLTAKKIVQEDKNAIYIFAIKNFLPDSDPNNYQKRILSCNFQNKNTVIGAAIRNLIEQKNQKKP